MLLCVAVASVWRTNAHLGMSGLSLTYVRCSVLRIVPTGAVTQDKSFSDLSYLAPSFGN